MSGVGRVADQEAVVHADRRRRIVGVLDRPLKDGEAGKKDSDRSILLVRVRPMAAQPAMTSSGLVVWTMATMALITAASVEMLFAVMPSQVSTRC